MLQETNTFFFSPLVSFFLWTGRIWFGLADLQICQSKGLAFVFVFPQVWLGIGRSNILGNHTLQLAELVVYTILVKG